MNEGKGTRMIGKTRGVMATLALAALTSAASLSMHAQAQAPGQPATAPGIPPAAPQTQPATPPAPPERKSVTTNLGKDFTRVKPMFPNPIAPYTWAPIPAPQFVNSPGLQQRIQNS